MSNDNICVVFVCNKLYFSKFINTCNQLVTNGKYTGNICLVIGDDLQGDTLLESDTIKNNNVIIKHFPDIIFSEHFLQVNNHVNSDGRNITKKFQWHKLHLFNQFFKQWTYIFYLDCGMYIYNDISPMLQECAENTLLAHSDAYPTYEWKLHVQFDKHNSEYFNKLNNTYKLDIDYFQTGMMLYDTRIIEQNTYDNLLNLTYEYPISRTNEQGVLALYFTNIKPLFKQIKTHNEHIHYYDCFSRDINNNYIMLKIPR
jgi:hypothetical protein